MAQQFQIQYIDDIDGTPLEDGGEHIEFSFDNKDYVIDLSDENAAAFREAMAPYLEAASKVTGGRKKGARKASTQRASGKDTKAVREWARNNGFDVSDRGRIPAEIVEAYAAAN